MIEETLKNRIILIIGILCLIFFVWALDANIKLSKERNSLQDEIRKRLGFEEQSMNSLKEMSVLEENIKQLSAQLEEGKAKYAEIEKVLSQEQLVNKSIKEELEKVIRFKEVIEDDLKEALMKQPQKKRGK